MSILFIPLSKADAGRRIVHGIAVSEVADRSNEIFDYKTSKPYFEKWFDEMFTASGGKSKGNLRSMHNGTTVAAGKLTDIVFDDANKAIKIAAQIVDDNEWRKVESGVYTGFSIVGRYAKRWDDGALKRYTAEPSEISLVDLPCVPSATFAVIKADGTEELRKFYSRDEEDLILKAMQAKTARILDAKRGLAPRCETPHWFDPRMAKAGLAAGGGGPHGRIVIGEVETREHGRLHVEVDDQGSAQAHLHLHDVHVPMRDIGATLRGMLWSTSAAFAAAANQEEQATQRTLIGMVVSAVLAEHKWLDAKVKERVDHPRYGAV